MHRFRTIMNGFWTIIFDFRSLLFSFRTLYAIKTVLNPCRKMKNCPDFGHCPFLAFLILNNPCVFCLYLQTFRPRFFKNADFRLKMKILLI